MQNYLGISSIAMNILSLKDPLKPPQAYSCTFNQLSKLVTGYFRAIASGNKARECGMLLCSESVGTLSCGITSEGLRWTTTILSKSCPLDFQSTPIPRTHTNDAVLWVRGPIPLFSLILRKLFCPCGDTKMKFDLCLPPDLCAYLLEVFSHPCLQTRNILATEAAQIVINAWPISEKNYFDEDKLGLERYGIMH